MTDIDQVQFDVLRTLLWAITLGACMSLIYIEYNTVKDSMLQSQLEAEYAYDYACSPSSQIIKKTEFGRNVYVSKTLWVNCGGLEQGLGNFKRGRDDEKSYPKPNAYDDMSVDSGLSPLRNDFKKGI